MKANIVDSTATQVFTGRARRVLITVNLGYTGSLKIIDNTTGTTANVGTVTNPATGQSYEYWDFLTGVRIIASTTCDLTVNVDAGRGAH